MMLETAKERIEEAIERRTPRTKDTILMVLRDVSIHLGNDAGNELIKEYRLEKRYGIKPVTL